jgi:hypothetical protein
MPTRLQRKLRTGCLPRRAFAWVPRRVHELACKHMICLQAHGMQTMICLQVVQQGSQGLQTYCKHVVGKDIICLQATQNNTLFIHRNRNRPARVQIGIHLIHLADLWGVLLRKLSVTLHCHLYFHLLVMSPSPQ